MSLSRGPGVRGRPFAKNNPGRKPGSQNKSTQISAALLDGELPELLRKAIELAKCGNVPLLKFLLGRLLPRDRLVRIDLPPILSTNDALSGLRHILRAVSAGTISPAEAAAYAALLSPFIDRTVEKPPAADPTPSLAEHLQSPDEE